MSLAPELDPVMTLEDALADGRLSDAIALQEAVVRGLPNDAPSRISLTELLIVAGRLRDALEHLRKIETDAPDWPLARREFVRLLKAEHQRTVRGRRPRFVSEPPSHARHRWAAIRSARDGDLARASHHVDRADARSPLVFGHVDGREFEGLRDTDDRFGSVLEIFGGSDYAWIPFEQLRRVTLDTPVGIWDSVFRLARLRLANGEEPHALLPLVYPNSHAAGDSFALGLDTDWPETGGLAFGVGARVLMLGDEEVPLKDIRQIEIRGSSGPV